MWERMFCLVLFSCFFMLFHSKTTDITGKEAYDNGLTLVQLGRDTEAAEALWTGDSLSLSLSLFFRSDFERL